MKDQLDYRYLRLYETRSDNFQAYWEFELDGRSEVHTEILDRKTEFVDMVYFSKKQALVFKYRIIKEETPLEDTPFVYTETKAALDSVETFKGLKRICLWVKVHLLRKKSYKKEVIFNLESLLTSKKPFARMFAKVVLCGEEVFRPIKERVLRNGPF